ncbi:acyl carrier protein [Candidatus Mesenet endosymbiont of Agriotes lineatus]|uniref:acyl carrier protein n=1 Tax=Candidatus Mesenet endosymbiont of Agriotes lineatus TaxID=3077948 RepID=UPI0030D1CAF0
MAELDAMNESVKTEDSSESNESIESRVKEIISNQFKKDISQLSTSSTFNDLGADSLDTVEVIMAVEDAFSISISDDDAQKMQNLGDIVKYIENKLKSN